MPIDFPNSPTVGQSFTSNNRTWVWNGNTWRSQGTAFGPTGPAGSFSVGTTPPLNPSEGTMWYNSDNSRMYIYYDAVWVEVSSALNGATGPTGPLGPTGSIGPTGPTGSAGSFSATQPIQNLTAGITLVAADAGSLKTNTGAAGNIAVNFSTLTPLTVGQQVDFLQTSNFPFVFSGGAGVTLLSKGGRLRTLEIYSAAGIKCISANTYVLIGDLGA